MSRLVRCLASAAFVAGVLVASAVAQAPAVKDWTVLVFMVGDDKGDHPIEDSQINDLLELSSVGSTAEVDLIVQMDRGPKLTPKMKKYYSDPDYSGGIRYHMQRDRWVVEEKLGEVNSGDPMVFYDALRWMARAHPARRYAVVINAHGSGVLTWRGVGSVTSATPGAVDFPERRGFTGYDDTDGDALSVFELADTMEAFAARLNGGRKVDVLGFDSCLSAMAEVLVQLQDSADYVVASPTLVPGTGFDYDALALRMARAPGADGARVATDMVETFIDSVGSNGKSDVLGAFSTAAVGELLRAWSDLSAELLRARAAGAKLSFQGLGNYSDRYWDLKKFCQSILTGQTGVAQAGNYGEIQARAQALDAARQASLVTLWYDGARAESKVGGLSVYWPDAAEYKQYRAFYKALDSSKAGFWDEFLDARELGIDP